MLRDVDTSLAAWLSGFLPPGTDVVFDPPGFDASSPRPDGRAVLGVYLHDVREEGELTPGDWSELRNDEGRLFGRVPPQRRYRLTYLLTAWAENTLSEHELLGNVLAGCAVQDSLPAEALRGSLVEMGQAVMARCAPLDRLCDPKELWAAWRIPPRTALELSVLAPLPVAPLTDLAVPPRSMSITSTRPPGGASGFGNGTPDGPPRLGRARIAE